MPKLMSSQHICEIEINRIQFRERTDVARQPVPTRPEGQALNVGVWVQHVPVISFTCHVDDDNLEILQAIYDSEEQVTLVLEHNKIAYKGWLSRMVVDWDGDRNWDNPWLVTFDLYSDKTREQETKFGGYSVDVGLRSLVPLPFLWQFREHRRADQGAAQYVQINFTKWMNKLRLSTGALEYGDAYLFITFPKTYVSGMIMRVVYDWYGLSWLGNYHRLRVEIWDGAYDRADDSTFPDLGNIQYKGNGLLVTLIDREVGSWSGEEIIYIPELANSTEYYVTIVFKVQDRQCCQQDNYLDFKLELFELKFPTGETIYSQDFTTGEIIMERTNTVKDYGKYVP